MTLWGVLATPPRDVQRWRRRLIRAYQRHRRVVVDRRHVAWAAGLLTEMGLT